MNKLIDKEKISQQEGQILLDAVNDIISPLIFEQQQNELVKIINDSVKKFEKFKDKVNKLIDEGSLSSEQGQQLIDAASDLVEGLDTDIVLVLNEGGVMRPILAPFNWLANMFMGFLASLSGVL